MEEQLQKLNSLIGGLPIFYTARSFSDLNTVLSKYTTILNYVNSYNDELKRTTSVYFSDITTIRDNIQLSLYFESQREKNLAFENARNELKRDMEALATLICPTKEMAEAMV